MPVAKSKYPCPNCGEHQLYYPDIKGEYGWKDTTRLVCYACRKEFDTKKLIQAEKDKEKKTTL